MYVIYCRKFLNSIIWIAGDLNLPDINWQLNTVQNSSYPHKISKLFIDALDSGGFNQMADSPTRNDNVLDLFATYRPSFVLGTKVLPGIRDHEIVLEESMLTAILVKFS